MQPFEGMAQEDTLIEVDPPAPTSECCFDRVTTYIAATASHMIKTNDGIENIDAKLTDLLQQKLEEETKKHEPEPSEKERMLLEASANGFDLRGPVGGWWAKALRESEALRSEYKELGKNYNAQRAFRTRWANAKGTEVKHTRLQTQRSIEVDEEDVTYEPVKRIVDLEGGDDAAATVALHYVARCIDLTTKGIKCRGRPFVLWNSFTLRYEYAYIKKKVRFVFEQSWDEQVKSKVADGNNKKEDKAEQNEEEKNKTQDNGPKEDTAKKSGMGRKRTRENMDIDDNKNDGENKQAARKDIDAAFRKAKQLKDRWAACSSTFFSLSHNIQNDPQWQWARGFDFQDLSTKKGALDSFLARCSFWTDWSIMDIMQLKKKYSLEDSKDQLKGIEELTSLVQALESKTRQLAAQQTTRLAN